MPDRRLLLTRSPTKDQSTRSSVKSPRFTPTPSGLCNRPTRAYPRTHRRSSGEPERQYRRHGERARGDVGQAVPAVGDRHRQLGEHDAGVVSITAAGVGHGLGQASGETHAICQLGQALSSLGGYACR